MSLKPIVNELRRYRRPGLSWLAAGVIAVLFAAGSALVFTPAWSAWLGTTALAEAMILSFYLSHDCAHLTAFATRRQNLVMGQLLALLSGGDINGFGDYRRNHLRHHAEQVDFVGVDLEQTIARRWRPLRAAIEALEACYIPALFFTVRCETLRQDIEAGGSRRFGAVAGLSVKLGLAAAVAAIRPQALLWLLLAVLVRIHCIRFVDAFQHTFEHGDLVRRSSHRGWAYEQRHTFSFPLFSGLKVLNLLILNFGYHNAHHAVPHCPWYNLPRLDAMLRRLSHDVNESRQHPYQPARAGVITLVKTYHKYRICRLFSAEPDAAYDQDGQFSLKSFRGVLSDHLLG